MVVQEPANGALNDDAIFRSPVTSDEVLASKVVADPLDLLMLCAPNEGAAAVDRTKNGVQMTPGAAMRVGGLLTHVSETT